MLAAIQFISTDIHNDAVKKIIHGQDFMTKKI